MVSVMSHDQVRKWLIICFVLYIVSYLCVHELVCVLDRLNPILRKGKFLNFARCCSHICLYAVLG